MIKTIRIDGTGARTLTAPEMNGDQPAWAPEGDRVLFMSFNDSTLSTVRSDGQGLTPLLGGQRLGYTPTWGRKP